MHADALSSPRIESHAGPKVGSFRDLHGAALAVGRLVDRGYSSEEVFVRPHSMEPLPGALATTTRRHLRRRAQTAALIAAALGAAALGAVTGSIGWTTLAATIGIAVAAAVATVVAHRTRAWRAERRRRRTSRLVRVSHFDIVVTSKHADAEHALASWWDPGAVPAGRDEACL